MNYKEKLEEAKRLYKFSNDDQRYVLEDLFPELKESEDEDEKIRIAILNYLRKMWANCKDNVCGVHIEDAIAWLEKQGEQKLINKIEPKFHVGEWLCENEPNNYARFIQILEIVNVQGKERYRISRDIRNDEDIVEFNFIEKYFHKFDIKDAKYGDVLVSEYNQPFIYNGNYNSFHVGSYCGVSNDRFIDSGSKCFWTGNVNIRPATKEKCDLLFKRMEEAGYKWDVEKKELKKIHVIDEGKAEMDYCFTKMMNGEKASSTWSEEDEEIKNFLIALVEWSKSYASSDMTVERAKTVLNWLKSIKDRVQPKQEWSEEDERNWNNIWDVLDGRFELSDYGYKEAAEWFSKNCPKGLKSLRQQPKQEWSEEDEKMFSELSSSLLINISDQWVKYGKWLKSLKDRITWKPTEAQLASLTIACDRNDRIGFDLTQLLEELKKL